MSHRWSSICIFSQTKTCQLQRRSLITYQWRNWRFSSVPVTLKVLNFIMQFIHFLFDFQRDFVMSFSQSFWKMRKTCTTSSCGCRSCPTTIDVHHCRVTFLHCSCIGWSSSIIESNCTDKRVDLLVQTWKGLKSKTRNRFRTITHRSIARTFSPGDATFVKTEEEESWNKIEMKPHPQGWKSLYLLIIFTLMYDG